MQPFVDKRGYFDASLEGAVSPKRESLPVRSFFGRLEQFSDHHQRARTAPAARPWPHAIPPAATNREQVFGNQQKRGV
jgi:hypothetical protein